MKKSMTATAKAREYLTKADPIMGVVIERNMVQRLGVGDK